MELNHDIIDTPPRDAASVVMLRDAPDGLQVLLLRRHADSAVLGGAYVFPGGKVDAADAGADTLARLDRPPAELHARLGEHGARLDTDALAPWSRWITPRRPSVMNKRFDTRFFLAAVPPLQEARHDDFEVTEARWLTPRTALRQYAAHEIDLAPPQIIGLLHLMQSRDVAHAMRDARSRPPPLIVTQQVETAETRVLCYPGDEHHPVRERALPEPIPTRVVWRNKRFEPPQGFGAFID